MQNTNYKDVRSASERPHTHVEVLPLHTHAQAQSLQAHKEKETSYKPFVFDRYAHNTTEQNSWVECTETEADSNITKEDRQCVLHNFCLTRSSFGKLFPQFQLHLTNTQKADKWQTTAQLSSYVEEGVPIYEQFGDSPPSDFASLTIRQHRVLVVYAPAAWPNQFPAHAINNNFVPLLRMLESGEPERRFKHIWEGRVWKYGFDMVLRCCGFAARALTRQERVMFSWLGVETQDIWGVADEFQTNEARCYERIHMGVHGDNGNWKKMAFDTQFWETLRLSTLAQCEASKETGGCKNSCWPPVVQETLDRPEVMLVQRDDKNGNVLAYGDRVFRNIDDLDSELRQMKELALISYRGVTTFNSSMTVHEQACQVSCVGILVGIHGNALSLSAYMQPRTILMEIGKQPPYYGWVATALRLHHIQLEVKDRTRPETKVFTEAIKQAVRIWKSRFN